MSAAPAISIESVSKYFLLGGVRGVRQALGLVRRERSWALRDITFDVDEGSVVGLIGSNGAGKSTLLKILARITRPSSGRATLVGQVSSLLEIGTGFHPDLTGRENVFMNGSILGMQRSAIQRRFDEIVEFSGVGRFIDTPVKHFSSGMRLRLAFSVAAHLESDILLVDEVLAVGDAEFQQRCIHHMQHTAEFGRTVIFVSHDMNAIARLCERTLLLEKGQVSFDGQSAEAIARHLANNAQGQNTIVATPNPRLKQQVIKLSVHQESGADLDKPLMLRDKLLIRGTIAVLETKPGLFANLLLRDERGQLVFLSDNRDLPRSIRLETVGDHVFELLLPAPLLAHGKYQLSLNIGAPLIGKIDELSAVEFVVVDDESIRQRRPAPIFLDTIWQER